MPELPAKVGTKIRTLIRAKDKALIVDVFDRRVGVVDAEENDGFVRLLVEHDLPD